MSIDSNHSNPTVKQRTIMSVVAPYQRPSRLRSNWQLVNSILPYFGLLVAMYFSLAISYWLTLAIAVIAAGFLVRIFILFHDCCHRSLFKSRKANSVWGVITGIISFTPYQLWQRKHNIHHETSGDLDMRGEGDVWMMTVKEYKEASVGTRLKYRFYRNPLVLLILGPLQMLLIQNRFSPRNATRSDRISVWVTNLGMLLMFIAAAFTIGVKAYILIQLPVYWLAGAGGIWLFYVQHQYEDVYWEHHEKWDRIAASLDGSSFYRLPLVLRWFSGNIGFHHVHHLSSQIPNYYLPLCSDDLMRLRPVRPLSFWRSLKSLRHRLWDEDEKRLVRFRHLKMQATSSRS